MTPTLDSFIISKMIGENKVFPIYDLYFKNFVYSTGFLNLIPLKFEAYILGYLLSHDFIKNKGNLATGTLMASLTNSSFNNLKIKRPIVENIFKTTQLITLLNKIEITIIQTNTLITNLINKLIN